MKKHLVTACLYTIVTAVGLGIIYPLVITGIAQLLFHNKANGQLVIRNGQLIGSRIIGQPFTGSSYFHSRPSAAGSGYDASSSSGSNLGPTNKSLITRIHASVDAEADQNAPVPIDLVTASASGLDPDISPAAALYQIPRVARARNLSQQSLQQLVLAHTHARQFGLLGEPTVNVVELNLALDALNR